MKEHKTTVRLPVELHRRVKAEAVLQGKTFSEALREALEQWLEKDSPEPKQEGEQP